MDWDRLTGKVHFYYGDIIHVKVIDQDYNNTQKYNDEEKARIVVLDATRLNTRWGMLSDKKLNEVFNEKNIRMYVSGRDEEGTILARVEI